MADDPYRVLGVDRDAEPATIRRAYLAQLRANHPDLRPGDSAAEERTRQLNRAWELIRRRTPRVPGPVSAPGTTSSRPARRVDAAYSHRQRDYRTAFTTATLRVALAVVALGLVLLAIGQ
ncbi:hypothetical protein BH23ACT10_BH23ACT10_21710 [soil metagenome]